MFKVKWPMHFAIFKHRKPKYLSMCIPKWRVVLLLQIQLGTYVWSLAVVNIHHIVRIILATIIYTTVRKS